MKSSAEMTYAASILGLKEWGTIRMEDLTKHIDVGVHDHEGVRNQYDSISKFSWLLLESLRTQLTMCWITNLEDSVQAVLSESMRIKRPL